MNLNNNPANDPWRNGMTDDQLMNLGWGGDIRGAIIQGLAEDAFKGRPAYLMNLDNNPANDPWRNGMTDDQLMNLITLKGAKDLYGKAKGTGLFNLEQDLDL